MMRYLYNQTDAFSCRFELLYSHRNDAGCHTCFLAILEEVSIYDVVQLSRICPHVVQCFLGYRCELAALSTALASSDQAAVGVNMSFLNRITASISTSTSKLVRRRILWC
jgi:hypothetical protein